jgi:hypothetical protein
MSILERNAVYAACDWVKLETATGSREVIVDYGTGGVDEKSCGISQLEMTAMPGTIARVAFSDCARSKSDMSTPAAFRMLVLGELAKEVA